jgi:hypothetical protein
MISRSSHRPKRLLAFGLCLASITGLVGCVENAKTVREAQAAFSRAATIENRSLLGADQAVQGSTEAATNYRMAATTMQKLISDKGGNLKKDNLLCTAMTIEALSWWRLAETDAALKVANDSSNCSDAPAGTQPARDLALFQALPGLIRIDQANKKISAAPTADDLKFDEVMALLSDANVILQTTRNQVGSGHPLQLYLIQSQLAIVRNWQFAIYKKNFAMDRLSCETGRARQQCVKLLAELACSSLGIAGEPSVDQLLTYWEYVAGCEYRNGDPDVLMSPRKSITNEKCAQLSAPPSGFPDNCSAPPQ